MVVRGWGRGRVPDRRAGCCGGYGRRPHAQSVPLVRASGLQSVGGHFAGSGSGFEDTAYVEAGAQIVDTPKEIYGRSDMVMHVKEPQSSEYDLIRENQIVFTYLHLAAEKELTHALIRAGSINIAYETIQKTDGSLPLLTPMSEVAGRMAIQQGAKYLEMPQGGCGVLLAVCRGLIREMLSLSGAGLWVSMPPRWHVAWEPKSIFSI